MLWLPNGTEVPCYDPILLTCLCQKRLDLSQDFLLVFILPPFVFPRIFLSCEVLIQMLSRC